MRILYLNHNVVGRGTWLRASWLARELVALGHDVTVLTTSTDRRATSREREWSGVRVIETPDLLAGAARTGWDPWNAAWRVGRLAGERFDLVHGFDCRPVVIVPALAQSLRTRTPLFLDWADWWGRGGTIMERSGWPVRTFFGPVETWFEEAFRSDAVANTTISEVLRDRCIRLGVDERRVIALPNGCAPQPMPTRESARAELKLPDAPVILHLGVMQKADATFLFDAFRTTRRVLPNARLVLVGPYAGPIPTDLQPFVTRTGFVDDDTMKRWLAAADVGAIPLRDTIASRGRWPGKLSEYLAAGLPVVMPAVGSAAELIERNGAARTSAPTSEALGLLLADVARDGAARERMGNAGRALAAGELSWSSIATQLLAFYQQWLGAR
jgi:glycosyltransferase involved in cell wall biosynthesis